MIMEEGSNVLLKTIAVIFSMGDPKWIIPIALCMVGVLIAAWKAPNWVRDIGLVTLVIGLLSVVFNYHSGIIYIEQIAVNIGHDDIISPSVLIEAQRHNVIAPICGLFVYIIAQIISLVQSPKR